MQNKLTITNSENQSTEVSFEAFLDWFFNKEPDAAHIATWATEEDILSVVFQGGDEGRSEYKVKGLLRAAGPIFASTLEE